VDYSWKYYRFYCLSIIGHIFISQKNRNPNIPEIKCGNDLIVQPGDYMNVTWRLPLTYIHSLSQQSENNLVIALLRYGSTTNANSIITKPIPSNAMAAGSPCRVLRENYYPRPLDKQALENLIVPTLEYWKQSTEEKKGVKDILVEYNKENQLITLTHSNKKTQFDIINKKITGDNSPLSEDLRDYLRRKGIKIFTGLPFVSLKSIV
jgi:hypothetical protein